MEDTVHNSQPTWAGNDPEPMHSSEEIVLALKEQVSTLQSQVSTLQKENNSMRTSGNDLLKEKTALKEQNTTLADIIANLNSYVTQLQNSALTASAPTALAASTTTPTAANPYREQKIPDSPLFAGDRSKARAWIMDMRLKLTADTQFFRTEQAKMIYINSRLEGSVKDPIYT